MATTNQSTNEAIKKVEDQITCPICKEHFTDPRVLPCFHSYCLTCLQCVPIDLVEGNYSLPCPTCRSPCPVPDKGIASLPPSFVVNNLVEVYDLMKKASAHQHISCDNCDNTNANSCCKQCATFLCPECLHHHNKWKPNAGHQILSLDEVASTAHQPLGAKQDLMSCTDHNKPLDLFCESCQQLICHDCTVKKHEKPLHKYDLLTDTYRQRKIAIDQFCIRPLKEEYDRLVAAQKILTNNRNEIPRNAQATNDDIWQAIAQIKNRLDETGKKLTQKVDSAAQYKVGVFDQQLKEVDTALGQVAECRDHVDQCVYVGSRQQVLLTTPQIISHTQSVIASVKDKTFQTLEQPDIQLVKSDTIPQIHESMIGEVKCTFQSAKMTLSRRHIPLINQESIVTIALSVPDGSPAPVSPSFINFRLTPPDNSPPIQCSVKESSQSGQYSVVFTPLTRGIHQLHVTVNGGNIPGSPVSVPVTVPPNMRGTPVKTITGLNEPRGVAVTDDGLVIVSEAEGHCITILDSEGRKIGTQGEGRGQLQHPQGVVITSKGTILVADWGNHRIQEFTMEGDCVSCVGTKGTGPLQFNYPRGITINKTTGQVFVADEHNHRVQVLHPDLTFFHMFGSEGSSQGQFQSPVDVAIDSQGYIYVTDTFNHRVQQFTPECQFDSSFGTEGSEPGQLYCPSGITLDDNDLVYVNNENQFIYVYTTNGQYITRIEKRKPESAFGYLAAITFDTNGDLYTCSTKANIVFVY